jgi:hypothetical protein
MATATAAPVAAPRPKKWAALLRSVEIFHEGTFREGTAEEWTVTEAMIDTMVENFRTFSAGPRPPLVPAVTVGHVDEEFRLYEHEGQLAEGEVVGLRKEMRALDDKELAFLVGDVACSEEIAALVRSGKLSRVSAETTDDPPEGLEGKGPTLIRVAFLGFMPPQLRHLKELPLPDWYRQEALAVPAWGKLKVYSYGAVTRTARFDKTTKRHRLFSDIKGRRPRKFAEGSPMDRAAMITFLQERGVDVALITDAVPDPLLAELVRLHQELEALKAEGGGNGGEGGEAASGASGRQPKAISLKFSAEQEAQIQQRIKSLVDEQLGRINDVASKVTAEQRNAAVERAKGTVRDFCARMVKDGKMESAEADETSPRSVVSRLLRMAEVPTVHRFSTNGKTTEKTELQLQMEEIEARPSRKFSERIISGGSSAEADRLKKLREDTIAAREKRRSGGGKTLQEKLGLVRGRAYR